MDTVVGTFTYIEKSVCWLRYVYPSVRPSVRIAAPTGRNFVKFDIGVFDENLLGNSVFG